MAVIYILKSLVNKRYYIGSTDNLKRRLEEHNSGKSRYTKLTKPFKLVFYKEYQTIQEARKIETKIKKFKSRKIIDKIVKDRSIRMRS